MDHKDFRKFYDTFLPKIFRFVLFRVGDRALAEDLVSEIFVKALKAFDRYDPTISVSSWIYTISRNHLANHFRGAGREVTVEDIEDLPIPGKDFVERAAVHQETDALLAVMATIPADKQALIRMKYLEELSYEEIAERTGKTKGALKVATHRAMHDLRQAFLQTRPE